VVQYSHAVVYSIVLVDGWLMKMCINLAPVLFEAGGDGRDALAVIETLVKQARTSRRVPGLGHRQVLKARRS
jgi:hypothetical protein